MAHVAVFLSRTGRAGAYLVSLIAATMVLLLIVEGGLRLTRHFMHRGDDAKDSRIEADAYKGEHWVKDCFKELESISTVWRPYVQWRRDRFSGKYVHVDDRGVRRTWNPECAGETGKVKILMLGGSSLWGFGARDDFTIPSYLSRFVSASTNRCTEVTNYAETGYVVTQEVVALIGALQAGFAPDIVIFYDGVNDVFSSFQNNTAGLPQNEINRRREFNVLSAKTIPLLWTFGSTLLKRSETYRAAKAIAAGRYKAGDGDWTMGYGWAGIDKATSERLAREVVRNYRSNMKIVEALGRSFDFKALFYWQPLVFHKRNSTSYESQITRRTKEMKDSFLNVYEAVSRSEGPPGNENFHDLSNIFLDFQGPIFIDLCHVSEKGNEIVARRIASDVLSIVQRMPGKIPQ